MVDRAIHSHDYSVSTLVSMQPWSHEAMLIMLQVLVPDSAIPLQTQIAEDVVPRTEKDHDHRPSFPNLTGHQDGDAAARSSYAIAGRKPHGNQQGNNPLVMATRTPPIIPAGQIGKVTLPCQTLGRHFFWCHETLPPEIRSPPQPTSSHFKTRRFRRRFSCPDPLWQ